MFRIALASSALALCIASPAVAQDKPIFDFLGYDTQTVSTNTEGCSDGDEAGEVSCTRYSVTLGEARADIIMVNLYEGRVSSVLGIAKRREYLSLLSAFTTKYGAPDRTETREWQNRAGGRFDNEVAIWEFEGGELELATIGSRITDSSFQFFHRTNRAPTEAPEVNF